MVLNIPLPSDQMSGQTLSASEDFYVSLAISNYCVLFGLKEIS